MKSNQLNLTTLMEFCLLLFKGEFPLAGQTISGNRMKSSHFNLVCLLYLHLSSPFLISELSGLLFKFSLLFWKLSTVEGRSLLYIKILLLYSPKGFVHNVNIQFVATIC